MLTLDEVEARAKSRSAQKSKQEAPSVAARWLRLRAEMLPEGKTLAPDDAAVRAYCRVANCTPAVAVLLVEHRPPGLHAQDQAGTVATPQAAAQGELVDGESGKGGKGGENGGGARNRCQHDKFVSIKRSRGKKKRGGGGRGGGRGIRVT